MDYETVVGVLRQIAQPIDYMAEDVTDPMNASMDILRERGWDVAAQCVMMIRYQVVMKTASSRPITTAWYTPPPAAAAEPADEPVEPAEPAEPDEPAEPAEPDEPAEPAAEPAEPVAWVQYVETGIENNDSAPFCEAVSAGHLSPELAFVLAVGVGTKISSADTLASMWRRCAANAAGEFATRASVAASAASASTATRVMFEAMVEAVGLAAESARGVLSLPPVLV